jgi:hypothetical protein
VKRESEFFRFAFVRLERDANGVSAQEGYRWPSTQPIAREDGSVEQVAVSSTSSGALSSTTAVNRL